MSERDFDLAPLRAQGAASDPRMAKMAALLAQVDPYVPSENRKARVRERLAAGRQKAVGRRRLVPALVTLLLVAVLGGTAIAFGGRLIAAVQRWVAPAHVERSNEAAPPSTPARPAATAPSPAPALPPRLRESSAEVPAHPASDKAALPRPRREIVPTPAPRLESPSSAPRPGAGAVDPGASPAPPSTAAKVPLDDEDDPAAVVEKARGALANETLVQAARVLRGGHDPAQAAMFAEWYLSHFPEGGLAEEALALRALAEQGAGRADVAARLRRQYDRRYPSGRYRDRLARELLGGP